MRPLVYTDQELAFVRAHYLDLGPAGCARRLPGRTAEQIRVLAKRLGLRWRGVRPDLNVDVRLFETITLPEVAYFLGYFWADGYIVSPVLTGPNNRTRICMEIAAPDAQAIMPQMAVVGRWTMHTRKRDGYVQPTTSFITCNRSLHSFLLAHDYDTKSISTPAKILAHIPEHLRPAFWLGYFDGDGSISLSATGASGHLSFTGDYESDWSAVADLFSSLGIRHRIYRRAEHPTGWGTPGRSSSIATGYRGGIEAFYRYIEPFVALGLPRKQQSFGRLLATPFDKRHRWRAG